METVVSVVLWIRAAAGRLAAWSPRDVLIRWILPAVMRLGDRLCAPDPDLFLETLLRGMRWTFILSRSYRRNIRGFTAQYSFATHDGRVQAAAIFTDGTMSVSKQVVEPCSAKITFLDEKALRTFLFSGKHDILDSMLNNEVAVQGNLNYVCKLGFLARDLAYRMRLPL